MREILANMSKPAEKKKPRILANRYKIVKKLGKGNYGTAYLCQDIKIKSTEEDGNL